jgi:hypothetical protein
MLSVNSLEGEYAVGGGLGLSCNLPIALNLDPKPKLVDLLDFVEGSLYPMLSFLKY